MKTANIYLIGPVGIFINEKGEAEGFTIDSVIAQVQAFKGQDIDTFNFKMRGPGGFVKEGDSIFDYMGSLRKDGIKINTEQIGDIGSIMTKLFLAPEPEKGEKRLVNKKFKFMIHNPWGGIEGEAEDITKYGEELEKIETELRNFYESATEITPEGLKPLMDKESEMTADMAIKLGFATGFVEEVIVAQKVIAKFNTKSSKMKNTETNTILDRLTKLGQMIKALSEKKEVRNLDLILEGGGTLRIDAEDESMVEGASAAVVNAEGSEEPAPEGEHILDDGRIAVIGADSTVVEIRAADEPEDEEGMKAELKKLKKENAELKKFKEEFDGKVEEKVEEKVKEINKQVSELTEGIKEVEEVKEQFKAMKTIYKVPENKDFVQELENSTRETRYDEGKELMKTAIKPKAQRGKVVSKS